MTAKKERISYAVGFNGAIGESLILQSFLSTYLLISGINIGISATVMLIVKVIDAVDDMLLGFLIDKIHPERNPKLQKLVGKGRYLPWLRLSFLVMPIAVILLYHIPEDAGIGFKVAWFSAMYLFADIGYTLLDIPMNALLITMTDNLHERDAMIASRNYWQIAIAGAVALISTVMISEQVGVSIGTTVVVMSVCMVICMIPMLCNVREHGSVSAESTAGAAEAKTESGKTAGGQVQSEEHYTLKSTLSYLGKNRNLLSLCAGHIIKNCLATGSSVGIFTAYYLFGTSLFTLVYGIAAIVPVLLINMAVPKLAQKYDKFVLGLYGWIPVQAESFAELEAMNFVQSEQALHGLWVISSGLPVIGVILGLICWSFYRLNDRDAALMAKVNQGELTREEANSQMKRTY